MGLWPAVERDNEVGDDAGGMWHYIHFHPAVNIRLDPVSDSLDGEICEATMVRNQGEYVQPLFKIYTDDKERSVGDLFIRHPKNPALWRHCGRSDDLLNFITTEKFHPAAAELRLTSHPCIEEVVMVGTRRPKGALIVRLSTGKTVQDIWNVVEEVNEMSPVYARVSKDMILVVDEPFLSTAKGTIQKKAMVEKYERELDRLYEKVNGVDLRVDIATTT
jgi:hypothetical protein